MKETLQQAVKGQRGSPADAAKAAVAPLRYRYQSSGRQPTWLGSLARGSGARWPSPVPQPSASPKPELATPRDIWPVPQAPGGGSALGTGDVCGGCALPALPLGHWLRRLSVRWLLALFWRCGGDGWVRSRAGGDATHQCCIFLTACCQQDLGSPPFLEDFWEMGVSCNLLFRWGLKNNLLVR